MHIGPSLEAGVGVNYMNPADATTPPTWLEVVG